MTFLLVIWRGWHFPLVILTVVQTKLAKLRPAVLKPDLVKSDATNLNFKMFVVTKVTSFIEFSVNAFFD